MKKHLLLGFLILFVLSTTAFAGLTDPKKESEKPAIKNVKENKLSDEEISRMNRPIKGIYNMDQSNLTNIEKNDLVKNPNATKQDVIVENRYHHHGPYIYGGVGLILVIIVIILLVR